MLQDLYYDSIVGGGGDGIHDWRRCTHTMCEKMISYIMYTSSVSVAEWCVDTLEYYAKTNILPAAC
jgi:hypothetical protein